MLEQASGLSPGTLQAIAELEREVVDADGGRLKLEWGNLRSRGGERVEDLLWWNEDRLRGFLGLYSFASPVELAGMVAPSFRRRGIGTALLDAALALCRARGEERVLLVVPRASVPGRSLALQRGAVCDHAEHALLLAGDPAGGRRLPELSLRPAGQADLPVVSRLLGVGFDWPAAEIADERGSARGQTLAIKHGDTVIGTVRVTHDQGMARIYGFVIDPAWQGRGLGREALHQVCEQLRAEGVERIGLEVAVDNERALTLYTSIGFQPVTTEDYYSLPVSSVRFDQLHSAR